MEMADNIIANTFGPTKTSPYWQIFTSFEVKGRYAIGVLRLLPTTRQILSKENIPCPQKFIFCPEAVTSIAGNELARQHIKTWFESPIFFPR